MIIHYQQSPHHSPFIPLCPWFPGRVGGRRGGVCGNEALKNRWQGELFPRHICHLVLSGFWGGSAQGVCVYVRVRACTCARWRRAIPETKAAPQSIQMGPLCADSRRALHCRRRVQAARFKRKKPAAVQTQASRRPAPCRLASAVPRGRSRDVSGQEFGISNVRPNYANKKWRMVAVCQRAAAPTNAHPPSHSLLSSYHNAAAQHARPSPLCSPQSPTIQLVSPLAVLLHSAPPSFMDAEH